MIVRTFNHSATHTSVRHFEAGNPVPVHVELVPKDKSKVKEQTKKDKRA